MALRPSVAIQEDQVVLVSPPVRRRSPPYLSEFEFATLIAARLLQLAVMNHEPVILFDRAIIDVATEEIRTHSAPLAIRRHFMDGTVEDWPLREGILVMPKVAER